MGMFDNITCRYPLPVPGANDLDYQTKDTDAQALDSYEIREDGTLWHENYDVEDHSDPNAEGLARIKGMMTRVNERWEQVLGTGEIVFYTSLDDNHRGWLQWSAYFVRGQLKHVELITHTKPKE